MRNKSLLAIVLIEFMWYWARCIALGVTLPCTQEFIIL